jgi:myo-inositol-1(or 4)-monophosphatase
MALTDGDLVDLLHETATAVTAVLARLDDWSLAGTRPGQYRSDLAADEAALGVLRRAPVGVLSEESGLHDPDRDVVVVIDPVDGSTNASRGIPWYATSLCAVDGQGPRVAVVVDVPHRRRFQAVRGAGASVDGAPIYPSRCEALHDAVVGVSGLPPGRPGWRQYRALGAQALDLCAVAEGRLDAYVDCISGAHGSWDYLGGLLVCQEAGAVVADAFGRDLVVLDVSARRTPLAAATPALHGQVADLRRGWAVTAASP